MNDTIIAFISPDFDSVSFEKIAESLRTQQIQITQDINLATVVIKPHKQSKSLTIAKLAEQQFEKTQQKLEQLIEQSLTFTIPEVLDFPDIQLLEPKPKKKHKIKNFISQRDLKRYNQTKQTHKEVFLNRTRCK